MIEINGIPKKIYPKNYLSVGKILVFDILLEYDPSNLVFQYGSRSDYKSLHFQTQY